jgi:hypothetical protein
MAPLKCADEPCSLHASHPAGQRTHSGGTAAAAHGLLRSAGVSPAKNAFFVSPRRPFRHNLLDSGAFLISKKRARRPRSA